RHGAAASLPRLGSMKGRGTDDGAANFEDPAASFEDPAANFEDPADRTPREDATDASAAGPAAAGDLTAPSTLHITEESAFHRSVIDFSSLLLPMREGRLGGLNLPGQIDYRDLAEQGRVPLIEVRGRREAPLSKHFRVGDFAAKDGAPYARIAPELVELLDDLTEHFGTRVHINSAYRHPGLNFSARLDGAADSRHMAGPAADTGVEGPSPFAVAEAPGNSRGCRIGLGLGEHYLHVDLRDWAASWTYPGAALPEADFDLWMIEQCEEFIAESVRQRAIEAKCAEPLSGFDAVKVWAEEMAGVARENRRRRGVVLVDVRTEDGGQRTEVGGQRAEVGGQRSEVGSQRSEVGGQRSEVGSQRSEAGSQRSEVGGQRSEGGSQRSEGGR